MRKIIMLGILIALFGPGAVARAEETTTTQPGSAIEPTGLRCAAKDTGVSVTMNPRGIPRDPSRRPLSSRRRSRAP